MLMLVHPLQSVRSHPTPAHTVPGVHQALIIVITIPVRIWQISSPSEHSLIGLMIRWLSLIWRMVLRFSLIWRMFWRFSLIWRLIRRFRVSDDFFRLTSWLSCRIREDRHFQGRREYSAAVTVFVTVVTFAHLAQTRDEDDPDQPDHSSTDDRRQ